MGELVEQTIKKADISVVIPCYNESNRIENCIIQLSIFFFKNRNKFDYEFIFINDGSLDDTLNRIETLSKIYPNIRFFSYSMNKGKGHAVRMGLGLANYKNILILDADLSVKPDCILNIAMWHNLNDFRSYIIIGEREQVVKQPFYRLLSGLGFRWLVKVLFDMPYTDSQCPLKILHNVNYEYSKELKIDGFAYDVELLYLAKKYNIKVHKTKVLYFNDLDSKVTMKKAMKMFFELLRIRFS